MPPALPNLCQGRGARHALLPVDVPIRPVKTPPFTTLLRLIREAYQCQADGLKVLAGLGFIGDAGEHVLGVDRVHGVFFGTKHLTEAATAVNCGQQPNLTAPSHSQLRRGGALDASQMPAGSNGGFAPGCVRGVGYTHPRAAMLVWERPPITRWSRILMSSSASACFKRTVIVRSAALGSGLPDGWLWKSTREAAL